MRCLNLLALFFMSLLGLGAPLAQAGVFDIPHFLEPGNFSLGLEPDLIMTPSAGVGLNFKYKQGVTQWMNVEGIVGTGGGPKHFRIGGNASFDFIPDVDKQPGIGIAAQALYVSLPTTGSMELTGIPYIHKSFPNGAGTAVDPFFSLPIGFQFSGGQYQTMVTAVVGTIFKKSENLSFSAEFGIDVDHANTYISGGLIYTH